VRTLPRITLLAVAAVAAIALTAADTGATPIKWGVRGGWNFDTVSNLDTGSIENSFDVATGYNFGLFADAGLGPLHVRPGITYIKTGSVFSGSSFLPTDDFDLSYVVFPVDAVVSLPVPIVSPYIATGPEFRVLASSGDAPAELEDQFKNIGMTWGVGLGFELGAPGSPARFVPEIRYSFDLSSVTEKEYTIGSTTVTSDGKMTSWRFSLGLMF
jgi:hypothetical protein